MLSERPRFPLEGLVGQGRNTRSARSESVAWTSSSPELGSVYNAESTAALKGKIKDDRVFK
ncbi:hypothetical protein BGZ72_000387, partial [Mortierella alpina]